MTDCPRCGFALWFGAGAIGRCDCDGEIFVAPCGCYRLNGKNGGSDYGCRAHSERLANGRMPSPDWQEILSCIELRAADAQSR